jgi:hypothetical protein
VAWRDAYWAFNVVSVSRYVKKSDEGRANKAVINIPGGCCRSEGRGSAHFWLEGVDTVDQLHTFGMSFTTHVNNLVG